MFENIAFSKSKGGVYFKKPKNPIYAAGSKDKRLFLIRAGCLCTLLVFITGGLIGLYFLFRHIENESEKIQEEKERCSRVDFPFCKYDSEFIPGCIPLNLTCIYDSRLGTKDLGTWWLVLGVIISLVVCGGITTGLYLVWGIIR